jgi:hypothetical protein
MKSLGLSIITLLQFTFVFSQNENQKGAEFQFQDRVQFYSVDERYNLNKDTVYHANKGFRVFAGYDTTKNYVIFRYPDWKKNTTDDQVIQRVDLLLTKLKNIALSNENEELSKLFISMINQQFPNGIVEKVSSKDFIQRVNETKMKFERLKRINDIDETSREGFENLLKQIFEELDELKKPVHRELVGVDGLRLALHKSQFEDFKDEGKLENVYSLKPKDNRNFTSGFMTIPFKLRPKQDTVNFNMTTDITLGAYAGYKLRVHRKGSRFIVFPATVGLSYINVGNSETSNVNTQGNSSVVPGWTWSLGVVFDIEGFNIGFVFGKDYASGVGDDWIYNKKLWYAFSIGYSFFAEGK